ncbi:hypothetical protein Pcinc_042665 [Petrolisthes cinctipes]|uniref:Uncharacterized protein n=1 Tax=Petrolisthes cinctipes TaxID=88211 RepID=A0AAE1BH13_PETCI|nr:hypothetical protein Pcinc_042665 [Petrolisthes cinctipes]
MWGRDVGGGKKEKTNDLFYRALPPSQPDRETEIVEKRFGRRTEEYPEPRWNKKKEKKYHAFVFLKAKCFLGPLRIPTEQEGVIKKR